MFMLSFAGQKCKNVLLLLDVTVACKKKPTQIRIQGVFEIEVVIRT